jgi:hypothetical protein
MFGFFAITVVCIVDPALKQTAGMMSGTTGSGAKRHLTPRQTHQDRR